LTGAKLKVPTDELQGIVATDTYTIRLFEASSSAPIPPNCQFKPVKDGDHEGTLEATDSGVAAIDRDLNQRATYEAPPVLNRGASDATYYALAAEFTLYRKNSGVKTVQSRCFARMDFVISAQGESEEMNSSILLDLKGP
jgi:hypothetical protein